MESRWIGAILALLMAMPTAAAGTLWTGQSAGFTVTWTDKDIRATRDRDGAPVFSASAFAAAGFAAARRAIDDSGSRPKTSTFTVTRTFRIVSLAGPYLALEDESVTDLTGSAHPGGETRFWTVDLSRDAAPKFDSDDPFAAAPGDAGSLVLAPQLFEEAEFLAALKHDSVVGAAIPSETGTLAEGLQALAGSDADFGGRCVEIPADLTSRFALIGLEAGRALVRIGLPGAGPCRYNLTQLGLKVKLRADAATAVTGVVLPPAGVKPVGLSAKARVSG
jgi:hypothetical protein